MASDNGASFPAAFKHPKLLDHGPLQVAETRTVEVEDPLPDSESSRRRVCLIEQAESRAEQQAMARVTMLDLARELEASSRSRRELHMLLLQERQEKEQLQARTADLEKQLEEAEQTVEDLKVLRMQDKLRESSLAGSSLAVAMLWSREALPVDSLGNAAMSPEERERELEKQLLELEAVREETSDLGDDDDDEGAAAGGAGLGGTLRVPGGAAAESAAGGTRGGRGWRLPAKGLGDAAGSGGGDAAGGQQLQGSGGQAGGVAGQHPGSGGSGRHPGGDGGGPQSRPGSGGRGGQRPSPGGTAGAGDGGGRLQGGAGAGGGRGGHAAASGDWDALASQRPARKATDTGEQFLALAAAGQRSRGDGITVLWILRAWKQQVVNAKLQKQQGSEDQERIAQLEAEMRRMRAGFEKQMEKETSKNRALENRIEGLLTELESLKNRCEKVERDKAELIREFCGDDGSENPFEAAKRRVVELEKLLSERDALILEQQQSIRDLKLALQRQREEFDAERKRFKAQIRELSAELQRQIIFAKHLRDVALKAKRDAAGSISPEKFAQLISELEDMRDRMSLLGSDAERERYQNGLLRKQLDTNSRRLELERQFLPLLHKVGGPVGAKHALLQKQVPHAQSTSALMGGSPDSGTGLGGGRLGSRQELLAKSHPGMSHRSFADL